MTNRQEREHRGAAWPFAIMALVGAAALFFGALFHDRYVMGIAVGCLPTGALGVLGAEFASRRAAALARRP